jgi:outer membrane protein
MQKLKDSNKTLIFKVKRKQTVRLGHKKGAELQKRATIELCATSIIAAVATRKWNRNGHISKWIKKFIKAYGKEKDILISTVRVMRHLSYMINMTLQKISLALNDKYKAAAKTEEKVEESRS